MPEQPSHTTQERILLVGLGEIAKTHLAVLADMTDVTVIGGVDIAPRDDMNFRGRTLSVDSSVERAAAHLTPTLVVVATPTATHAAVCVDVARHFPDSAVLVEKPVADSLLDARQVLTDQTQFPRLRVAYHFQHAPEVRWGLETVRRQRADLGEPVSARAVFADAYESDARNALVRYGSSWLDSGINALSILSLFANISRRTSIRQLGDTTWSTYEARFSCESDSTEFNATIVTTWHVTEAAKTTTIEYSSGSVLMLDHTGVAGYLFRNGQIADMFGTDGSVNRRYSHYSGLYRSYLAGSLPAYNREVDLRLHEFLLAGP